MLGVVVISVVSTTSPSTAKSSIVKDPSQLLIVDCLLPGQVRKIGGQMTYLTARRPVKTTASDCEIRGGEYVAFDRANYATALQVWLPLAEQGDAAAQTYVGEIYEKGLGRPAEPAAAASWYQKAADQKFGRAQSNLAYLYEKGIGVPKDRLKALNLYRMSAGLPDDDSLVFESEVDAVRTNAQAQIEALARELQSKVTEADELRAQLEDGQRLAQSRRAALAAARTEATALQAQLANLRATASPTPTQVAAIREREAGLATREAEVARQEQQIAALERTVRDQRESLAARVAETEERAKALRNELGTRSSESASATARLAAAEERVRASNSRISELESELAREREAIRKERARLTQTATAAGKTGSADRARIEVELQNREARARQQQTLIAQLQQQNQSYAGEVARLKREHATQQGAIQRQAAESATIRAQLASTEQQLLSTQQKLTQTSSQLDQERRRIETERQALERSRAAGDARRQEEIERLNRELAKLESDNINQKARIAELTAERSEYRTMLASAPTTPAYRSSGAGVSDPDSASRVARQLGVGPYHALIIGNNSYAYMPTLDSAIKDAQAIDRVLRDRYGFKTRVLLNATRAEILSALNEYRLNLRESDSLLIYYAGHGELDTRNLTGYWLPVNAKRDDTTEWISDRMITEQINLMAARHIMIVADSCYSGAMTRSSGARLASRGSDDAELRRLKLLAKLKSRTVLTSGGEAPVLDGGGGQHSIFARAFLDVLGKNSGVLEGSSVYNAVFDPVRRGAARFKVEQSPRYSQLADAGHGQGEFLFVPRA